MGNKEGFFNIQNFISVLSFSNNPSSLSCSMFRFTSTLLEVPTNKNPSELYTKKKIRILVNLKKGGPAEITCFSVHKKKLLVLRDPGMSYDPSRR